MFLIATPIAAIVAFVAAGGPEGGGTAAAVKLFFPWSVLAWNTQMRLNSSPLWMALVCLSGLSFPLYGIALEITGRGTKRMVAAGLIVLLHAAAVCVAW
jgi:hypothetical protein